MNSFEEEFGKVFDGGHAFAFWKGRTALYAILEALDIKAGDEVIVPGFTCVVVPNSVRALEAVPVYADVAEEGYNVDPGHVESLMTSKTRAIVVQHTFGIPADMETFLDISERRGVPIIEDCAHTVGSQLNGRKLGTFGIGSFFSTQWSKPFTTGLGGVALTRDEEFAQKLGAIQKSFQEPSPMKRTQLNLQYEAYRRFFSSRTYWVAHRLLNKVGQIGLFVRSSDDGELEGEKPQDLGWKMAPRQARIGVKALAQLKENLSHRRSLAGVYEKQLRGSGWAGPVPSASDEQALLRYPVLVENKWELLEMAEKERIELGSWFESPLHPVRERLDRFGYRTGSCPRGEFLSERVVNLPVHPRVTIEEAEKITDFFLRNAIRPRERIQTSA